ncbi:MAG: transglutaminase domain-containing protein [Candidatus Limivicinus sp.]|jgi:hypothetical protein
MYICKYCGTDYNPYEGACPVCGAELPREKLCTVKVFLSRKEARSGCRRVLSYPGALRPIRVALPGRLKDGTELFIDDVRYTDDEGQTELRPLRLVISVKKKNISPAALLLPFAAALIMLILCLWLLPSRERGSEAVPPGTREEPELSSSEIFSEPAVPVSPIPIPTETPLSPVRQEAMDMIPHFELRYCLNELDDRLLENFCTLYSAVSNFDSACRFPQPLNKDELMNLMLLLSYECPELLQFSSATELSFYSNSSGNVISAALPIDMTREEYARMYELCRREVASVAESAAGMSESDREMLAYNYLADNCFYSYDAPNAHNAYGALVDKTAKCDGISLAMKWLCEEMGISCMVIAGNTDANPIGHAWNIIRIDGTYYDLDVTNDVNSDSRDYCYYGAFNVSRHWIRDKYPENRSYGGFIILPGSESMGMSYHALNGSYVPAGEDGEQLLYEQLNNLSEGEVACLQFESWSQYAQFVNDIDGIMARWEGLSQGDFNFSLSHLDEFQVCRVSVNFI